MQTVTKPDGTFIFCPVPSGSFDVVADALAASSTGNIAYNATVTFSVPSGAAMGNIPIVAETGSNTSPVTISGQNTSTTGLVATQADISASASQTADGISVPIPPLGLSFPNGTTQPGSCPQNTDCAEYTLIVPACNPSFGTFNASSQTTYSSPPLPIISPVGYTINAQAFIPMSSSSANPGGAGL